MVPITALWIPILVSAVAVFIASSVLHMVLPFHRKDYAKLPGEDEIAAAVRKQNVAPGSYMMPHAGDPKEMGSPEMQEKFKNGPVAMVTVFPSGVPVLPKHLAMWFVYTVVIGVCLAYLAGRTLVPGTAYLSVFRFVGTAGWLAYAGSIASDSIWRGQAWSTTCKNIVDGLVYALVTAGVFGWLWPQ